MKTYIMTKIIHAVPARMVNSCVWPEGLQLPELPEPEKAPDGCTCVNERLCHGTMPMRIEEGYLYTESSEDTYPKWMCKEEFERICRPAEETTCCVAEDEPCECGCNEGEIWGPCGDMTFGEALMAVKRGQRIARKGWNGKGMYVFLAKDPEFHTEADLSEFEEHGAEVFDLLVLTGRSLSKMRIREALKEFGGAQVSHPDLPARKLQNVLMTILSAARQQADLQDQELADLNEEETDV